VGDRGPGARADGRRVRELCQVLVEQDADDAAAVWSEARTGVVEHQLAHVTVDTIGAR